MSRLLRVTGPVGLKPFRMPNDDAFRRLAKDSARNREELAALEQKIQRIRLRLGQLDVTKYPRQQERNVLR